MDLPKEFQKHSSPSQFKRNDHPDIIYANLPETNIQFIYPDNPRGYFGTGNNIDQHTNSRGFRGPEFSDVKATDSARIIFLGDSFTFGEGVFDNDTYPAQFEKIANENNLYPGKKVESINLGVGGYNTQQEWFVLKDMADKWQPDLIILGYILNDVEAKLFSTLDDGLVRRNREAQIQEVTQTAGDNRSILEIPRINRLISSYFKTINQDSELIDYYNSIYRDENPNWVTTKEMLKNFGDYSKQKNIPVLVVIFPLLFELNDNYPFSNLHQKVITELKSNNLEYIDLRESLNGLEANALWVYPTDPHPNEIVHFLAAKKIFEKLGKKI